MKNRYYFIDNLRWVCVVLVLIYHVFYNFNSLGVFGAVCGGLFGPNQWQDIVCTALNPWFMTLMFVVAGASSRYALTRRTPTEFRKERMRKLLGPSTVGLFVFGWVLGLVNISSEWRAMMHPLQIRNPNIIIANAAPTRPSSSQSIANIMSFAGSET